VLGHARAAIYERPNAPFIIREYPLRDVKADEVLVQVLMSTICRSDIHSYRGLRPNPCPSILGHEIVGVIHQLGSAVRDDLRGISLAEGDRLTWTEYFWSNDAYFRDVLSMPQKTTELGKYGHERADKDPHLLGGFAEYCYLVPHTGILKLPDEITNKEAAPINCGAATMMSVCEASCIGIGDVVVVQGLGLLGLYACAIAQSRSARLVIGLDTVAARVDLARRFGANEAIDVTGLSESELISRVRGLAGSRGADVVIEVCGNPDVVPVGIEMLRIGGRYTLGGLVNPGSVFPLDGNQLVRKWITLRGIHNYHPRHLVQAVDFVSTQRNRFPFGDLVDGVFSLNRIDEAFARAAERTVLRAAIVP
jgi:putative phosphonate catabolism associated alcohol dehydrogenase